MILSILILLFSISEPVFSMPTFIFHGLTGTKDFEIGEVACLNRNLNAPGPIDGDDWTFFSVEYAGSHPKMNTIIWGLDKQAENACNQVKNHFALNDYNWMKKYQTHWMEKSKKEGKGEIAIIGHSQGGLVGRWTVENCDFGEVIVSDPESNTGSNITVIKVPITVSYFISVGGPQRGIVEVPTFAVPQYIRPFLDWFISWGYLLPGLQKSIGPAGMVYNPKQYQRFLDAKTFLGRINNEVDSITNSNQKQKERILGLKKMLLIEFAYDGVVVPKESEFFSQISTTDGHTLLPVEKTGVFWDNDLIGLKELKESGRLLTWIAPRPHDQLQDVDREQSMVPLFKGDTEKIERMTVKGGELIVDHKSNSDSTTTESNDSDQSNRLNDLSDSESEASKSLDDSANVDVTDSSVNDIQQL